MAFRLLIQLGLATAICAQAPSEWSVETLSSNVQTANLHQRGKILVYRDGNKIRAWSALTRAWRTLTVSTGAAIRIANDVALVVDGARYHAFGSHSGKFVDVTLSSSARVVNPQAQRNDSIVLVRDGNDLWSFSGFGQAWSKRTIAANARVAVQRHVAVVAEDKRLLGLSAFRGSWVATTTTAVAAALTLRVDGTTGVAESASTIWGFSATRGTWASSTLGMSPTGTVVDDDLAVWWDGIGLLAFSGLRGTFARQLVGAATSVTVTEQVALAHDGNGRFWFFAAPTAGWTATTAQKTAQIRVLGSHALIFDATHAIGLSGPRGTARKIAFATTQSASSCNTSALVDGTGKIQLFSALTAAWTAGPAHGKPLLPRVSTTGALLETTKGVTAWSARTGTFHDLPTTNAAQIHMGSQSAVVAIEDGKQLAVFEPRRNTWLRTTTKGAAPLKLHLWRTSLVAYDGDAFYGYGAFHGRLSKLLLPGTFKELNSNSESSRVVMERAIAAFSAVPLLSTPWQYPEFRRTFVAGADLDLHLSAASSTGRAWLALGVQPPFTLPGLGDVLLDGTQLLPWTVPLDARTATATTSLPVPDLPGLRGLELFMQALVVPTSGQPYVTSLASVLLY